jgi:NAD-dependent SIR2 family protein deacetylase
MKVLKNSDSTVLSDDVEKLHSLQGSIQLNTCSGCHDNATPRKHDTRDRIDAYSSLIAGLSSGAISSTICAPLDLVRTRIQVMGEIVKIQQGQPHPKDHIAVKMIQDIIQRDGLAGCFRGLTATLLTVPTFWGVYC